jgi:hypothetical protein
VILEARDSATRDALYACLESAVRTLLGRSLGLAPDAPTATALWSAALGASYRAELRPESSGRAEEIVAADAAYYEALTRAYAGGSDGRLSPDDGERFVLTVSGSGRRLCRVAWFFRRLAGKFLSTGRWFKAAATFEGGIDYAVWKLERHTGQKIEVSDKVRRRPWLYAWGEIIRLYRSGTLR